MESFEEVDIHKAKEMLEGDTLFVDVRGKEYFDGGHIKGATYVDDTNIEGFVQETDKEQPILCYCHMGFSSKSAAQYLKDQGFKTVYSMTGGITQWQNEYADFME